MRTLPAHTRVMLLEEITAVRGELARIDAKAATIVGLDGAGLLFSATAASAAGVSPVQAGLLLLASSTLALSALAVLIGAARPTAGPTGLHRWAGMGTGDVLEALAGADEADHGARELVFLSTLAAHKYRAIRRGVDALVGGVLLLAATVLAGVIA